MMKAIVLGAFACLSIVGFAADEPTSAAALLEKAAKGRAEYIEVVDDLRRRLPDMADKKEAYPFVDALSKFEEVGKKLDLDTVGNGVFAGLKIAVTRTAAKWIDLVNDDEATVATFLRYAEDASRFSAMNSQLRILSLLDEPKAMDEGARRTAVALAALRKTDALNFVLVKAEEAHGLVLRKLVGRCIDGGCPQKDSEIENRLVEVDSPSALTESLTTLQQAALTPGDKAKLLRLERWTLVLAKRAKQIETILPIDYRLAPGKIWLDLLTKALQRGHTLPETFAGAWFEALYPTQLEEAASLLTLLYDGKTVDAANVDFLWNLTAQLAARLEKLSSLTKAADMRRLHQQLSIVRFAGGAQFEGTYDIELEGPAEKGSMTVAAIGSSNFVIGIARTLRRPSLAGDLNYDRGWNFYDVVFAPETATYVGQYRAVESPKYLLRPETHHHVKDFKLLPQRDGSFRVEGQFFDGTGPARYRKFTGVQREKYKAFLAQPVVVAADKEMFGAYRSTRNGQRTIEVMITRTGTSLGGVLYYGTYGNPLVFEWGFYNPHRNAAFLTSGEYSASDRFFHLRGQFSPERDEFVGELIVSGTGIKEPVELRRVKESSKE